MLAKSLRIPSEGSCFEVGENKTVFEITKSNGRILWAKSVATVGQTFDGKIMNDIQNFKINGVKFGLESMKIRNGRIFISVIAGKVNRTQVQPEEKVNNDTTNSNTEKNI